MLEKSEHVLSLAQPPVYSAEFVMFSLYDSASNPPFTPPFVSITETAFRDMGSPMELTVTLVPGDSLTEGGTG